MQCDLTLGSIDRAVAALSAQEEGHLDKVPRIDVFPTAFRSTGR